MGNNISYQFLSKFYDLFDLIFLFGGKGNPRYGLLDTINNIPLHILDVCCGTGANSNLVASHHASNRVIGIDISDEMLAVAKRKMDHNQLTNLEYQTMSAAELQFNDGSFDVVMISFALHEFEKELRGRVIQEMARVLKPGGTFCVVDFAQQDNWINRGFIKVWTAIEPPCFTSFLGIDWQNDLSGYGLIFGSKQEFSFSDLYVLHKSK